MAMRSSRTFTVLMLAWLAALSMTGPVRAGEKMPPIDQKAFSSDHVVLQISEASPAVQTRVLNVAANLIKYYGPDKLDLEVVAFAGGLQLLMADNPNAARIRSLAENYGVHFDACENTLQTLTRELGHTPRLNPVAVRVPSGAARIVELVQHGYVVLRP
jgi:uncharacterized protein